MNENEIYKKIKKITNLFDVVQQSIEFYRKEFSLLEDKLATRVKRKYKINNHTNERGNGKNRPRATTLR